MFAVIQGITEFLPISSSGHLALFPAILDWKDQGVGFDIAVHLGTLLAVIIYFWKDIFHIICCLLRLENKTQNLGCALLLRIFVSLPPILIAGGLVAWLTPELFRSPEIIAFSTIGFGIVLWIADRSNISFKRIENMPLSKSIIIGLAQILAVIPGTSRSGITITAARMLGVERTNAARFSMLMSIPVIIAAGGASSFRLINADQAFNFCDMGIAIGISFITALISISFLMNIVRLVGFGPFVIYRIGLGASLLVWIYAYN